LRRPGEAAIRQFLADQAPLQLTYEPVGISSASLPHHSVDEIRVRIGTGRESFERAKLALESWDHFDLGWVFAWCAAPAPLPGADVAVAIKHLGFWSLNGCRVLGRFPAHDDDPRYGFYYGTLSSHAESGEELFAVEIDPTDGSVWYQIRAVSRPRAWLAIAGYPYTRWLQRRFRRDSVKAMTATP
jgi:uncharacterized protein (UPF0548 family)